MNDDTIYRQAAIDAMECVTDSICEQQAIDALADLPSAERYGRWIDDGLDGFDVFGIAVHWYKCSGCGFSISRRISTKRPHFCENCGARMEGE